MRSAAIHQHLKLEDAHVGNWKNVQLKTLRILVLAALNRGAIANSLLSLL